MPRTISPRTQILSSARSDAYVFHSFPPSNIQQQQQQQQQQQKIRKLTDHVQRVEEFALHALDGMHSVTTTNEASVAGPGPGSSKDGQKYQITVKTPKLFHFSRPTFTLVMEDLPSAVDLKTFMRTPGVAGSISREWTLSIGRTLGAWLRSFHFWVSDPAQEGVATRFAGFTDMRDLKFTINYDGILNKIDVYPEILGESREVFEKVREAAKGELEGDGEMIGAIHGDFWSGKYVLPYCTSSS